MREMVMMVVVLTILSLVSAGGLAYLQDWAAPGIEINELNMVKGPVIRSIMNGAENDPVNSRFDIQGKEGTKKCFVGVYDKKPKIVAFETLGKGYGGDVNVMVTIDVEKDTIYGIGVTTHSETPGLGANAKAKPDYVKQFTDKSVDQTQNVRQDGGEINAMGGATITSRAVCAAVNKATEFYKANKSEIVENLKKVGN